MSTTEHATSSTVEVSWLVAKATQGAPPRILDVRTPAEFESVHIRGSYNVPLETLKDHRDELAPHLDEDVVLVCRSGQRSQQAGQALAGAGLPGVKVLSGGIVAYEAAGADVERGQQRWELERQVRLVAGSLVLTAVTASVLFPPLKWLGAAVGGGLTFAAVTNSCAMGNVLSRLPYNQTSARDPREVIGQIARREQPA